MISNFPHGRIWAEYLADQYANLGSESDAINCKTFNSDEKKLLKYFTQSSKFKIWLFIMNKHYSNKKIFRSDIEKYTDNSQSTVLRCCMECCEAGYLINIRRKGEASLSYKISDLTLITWEKYIDHRLDSIMKFEMDLSIRLRRTEKTVFKKNIEK